MDAAIASASGRVQWHQWHRGEQGYARVVERRLPRAWGAPLQIRGQDVRSVHAVEGPRADATAREQCPGARGDGQMEVQAAYGGWRARLPAASAGTGGDGPRRGVDLSCDGPYIKFDYLHSVLRLIDQHTGTFAESTLAIAAVPRRPDRGA